MPYPSAALAKSSRWTSRDHLPSDLGSSWRANVWIPTDTMITRGLHSTGYPQPASLVAHYPHDLVVVIGNREYYDAETGEGWSLPGHFLP